ncbi:MAG: hypothetical protein WCH44_04080 [Betaproteobacteria bacterium]
MRAHPSAAEPRTVRADLLTRAAKTRHRALPMPAPSATDVDRTDINDVDFSPSDGIQTPPQLEREFGITHWIDPQTGEPAAGQSPPHVEHD